MKQFFIVSHNEFALGLKKSIEMIVGKQENLQAYAMMPGDFPGDIAKKIQEQITEDTEVVILGDLAGGSVCNSCLPLTTLPNVVLVAGVNLPLAIELIVTQTTDEKEIKAVIEQVRPMMKVLNIEMISENSEEDFF